MSEDISKLRWRCRRGMRELDSVLINFLDNNFSSLNKKEQIIFKQLLELPDPELHSLIMGKLSPNDRLLLNLLESIRLSIK